MKQIKRVLSTIIVFLVLILLISAMSFTASAATLSGTCGDDLTWTLNTTTGVFEITGTGDMAVYSSRNRPWFSYKEYIKKLNIGDSVTSISSDAFSCCENLKSINFGDSLESIGYSAFNNCWALTSVNIPDSVIRIDGYAFFHCYSVKSVSIGDSVTVIGNDAFRGCDGIQSLSIGKSVKEIQDWAFSWCISLKNVKIPASVTSIGANAFNHSTSLSTVSIPNSVTSIGEHAFEEYLDGKYYLLDVTIKCNENSYARTYAINNGLKYADFCTQHSFTDYISDNNFNCLQDGTKTAYCNNGCGATNTITDVGSKNHVYQSSVFEAASCFKPGVELHKCVTCSDSYTTEIPVADHLYTGYLSDGNATCSVNGTLTAYCDYGCGTTNTIVDESPLTHSFTNYISDNNAGCFADGTKTAFCDYGCGTTDTVTDINSKLSHSFTEYISNDDFTCITDGTKTAYCDNGCGTCDTVVAEGSALGHAFTNYKGDNNETCTVDGTKTAYCENGCGACDTVVIEGSALGHEFTNYKEDNNETCTVDGTKTAYCENGCGACDTVILEGSAFGHSFTDYIVIKELSCLENGIREALCDRGCGEKDIIIEEAKGHISSEWIVVQEATYKSDGNKIKECIICSEIIERATIPMLAYEGFPDVWGNSWYAEGVEYCYKNGYILGTDTGLFKPHEAISREQFVLILARVAMADLSGYTNSPFTDVNVNSWYAPAVIWANDNGIVLGIGEGIFGTGKSVSREEIAVILYRFADFQGIDTESKTDMIFCDDRESISAWAKNACAWAIDARLLSSTSDSANLLSPKMVVTRAQAAKIFMSYDKITETE